ncbi:hypothetical protein D3C80_1411980 [compost metagenome]
MFAATRRTTQTHKDNEKLMPARLRSFIGTIIIIIMVLVYAILATSYAAANLAASPWWVHLMYFTGTGLLWVLPAMALIKWMAGRKSGK